MAQRFKREILPATEDRPQIELVRSARRTRTISMQRDGEDAHGNPAYRLLIPAASTSEEIDEHIARLLPRIQRRAARRERATQLTVTDEYLRSRALHLAQKNLPELVASGRFFCARCRARERRYSSVTVSCVARSRRAARR